MFYKGKIKYKFLKTNVVNHLIVGWFLIRLREHLQQCTSVFYNYFRSFLKFIDTAEKSKVAKCDWNL